MGLNSLPGTRRTNNRQNAPGNQDDDIGAIDWDDWDDGFDDRGGGGGGGTAVSVRRPTSSQSGK